MLPPPAAKPLAWLFCPSSETARKSMIMCSCMCVTPISSGWIGPSTVMIFLLSALLIFPSLLRSSFPLGGQWGGGHAAVVGRHDDARFDVPADLDLAAGFAAAGTL